jgi:hypothetical protein
MFVMSIMFIVMVVFVMPVARVKATDRGEQCDATGEKKNGFHVWIYRWQCEHDHRLDMLKNIEAAPNWGFPPCGRSVEGSERGKARKRNMAG